MAKRPGRVQQRAGGPDDSQGEHSVALTRLDAAGNIVSGLNGFRPKISIVKMLLAPLREGKPVILRVTDPRLPKRKRVDKPLLFLTPLTAYGRLSSSLVVALQAHGCEVCDTKDKISAMVFYRAGLSMTLSNVLASELNQVFTFTKEK